MKLLDKLNVYRGLPKPIYIMFIARIVNAMGNFVFPFLTLFLTERLKLSPSEAGTYFMLSAFSQAIGSIIGGKLTDHFGRKKLFLMFQFLAVLCFLPCPFLGNSLWIPKLIIVFGLFAGTAQPATASMIIDLTNQSNRKQAYSLLYLGTNLGFSIGPLIAGFLYKNHTNWIFFGNIISIFIVLILISLFVKETKPSEEQIKETKDIENEESAEVGSLIAALIKRPKLVLFLLGKLLNTLIYSTIAFAIPIQLIRNFGSSLGSKYFGIVMSLNGIVVVTCTILVTRLTIKFKPIIAVALASLFYGIGFGMLGFANVFWLYIVASIIYTIGEIIEATNAGVYIANNSPITHRGRFNSIVPLISGVGFAFGPYIFGSFIEAYGLRNMWIFCFCLGIISSAFMKWLDGWKIGKTTNEN